MHGTRSRVWTFLMLSVGSLAWATQSLAADPDEAGLHCRRALALKQARVFDGALAEAREALAACPDSAEAHWVMAWLEAEHGSAANAAREFQAVIRLAPDAARATEAQQAIARLATRGVTIPAAAAPALPAVDDPPAPVARPEPAGTPPAAATAGEAAPPTTAEPQDGGDSDAAQSVADAAPPHEPADQPEPAGTPTAAATAGEAAPPTTAEPQDGGDSAAAQSVADAAPPHEPAHQGATARVQRAVERALSSGVGTALAREALQPLRQALPARPPLCVHPSTYARLRALGVRDDEMDGDGDDQSAGTHGAVGTFEGRAFGHCIDIPIRFARREWFDQAVEAGFVVFVRNESYWNWQHLHIIDAAPLPADGGRVPSRVSIVDGQLHSWLAGRNGLRGNGPLGEHWMPTQQQRAHILTVAHGQVEPVVPSNGTSGEGPPARRATIVVPDTAPCE